MLRSRAQTADKGLWRKRFAPADPRATGVRLGGPEQPCLAPIALGECPALSIPAVQNMRDILDASLYVRKHFLKLCDPRLLIFKHPANIRHIEHPDRGLAR